MSIFGLIILFFILQAILAAPFPSNITVLYTEKINSNISAISNQSISVPSAVSAGLETTTERIVETTNNSDQLMVGITEMTTIFAKQEVMTPELLRGSDVPLTSEDEITYKFRGPNPITTEKLPLLTREDQTIRDTWGGDCTYEHWQKCSKLKVWGGLGGHYAKDKRNPGKVVWVNNGTQCDTPDEKFYCLVNGYTVARCHLQCMAQCNKDYLVKYDQVVKHEGQCALSIG